MSSNVAPTAPKGVVVSGYIRDEHRNLCAVEIINIIVAYISDIMNHTINGKDLQLLLTPDFSSCDAESIINGPSIKICDDTYQLQLMFVLFRQKWIKIECIPQCLLDYVSQITFRCWIKFKCDDIISTNCWVWTFNSSQKYIESWERPSLFSDFKKANLENCKDKKEILLTICIDPICIIKKNKNDSICYPYFGINKMRNFIKREWKINDEIRNIEFGESFSSKFENDHWYIGYTPNVNCGAFDVGGNNSMFAITLLQMLSNIFSIKADIIIDIQCDSIEDINLFETQHHIFTYENNICRFQLFPRPYDLDKLLSFTVIIKIKELIHLDGKTIQRNDWSKYGVQFAN